MANLTVDRSRVSPLFVKFAERNGYFVEIVNPIKRV